MLLSYIFPDAFGQRVELYANIGELSTVSENRRNIQKKSNQKGWKSLT